MHRRRVLLVVTPHAYATALAASLDARGRYDVVVVNVMDGETEPRAVFEVVVTNLPFERHVAPVVISLPEPPASEFTVTTSDLRVAVPLDAAPLVEAIADLVERYSPGDQDVRAR